MQIDVTEVDGLQVTPPKDGFGKVSSVKEGSSQESLSEIGSLQRRLAQVGADEGGTDEMGMVEIEMFELGFAEISNHIGMTMSPAILGLSSIAQECEVKWVGHRNTLLWVRWACVAYALARSLTRNHFAGQDMQHALAEVFHKTITSWLDEEHSHHKHITVSQLCLVLKGSWHFYCSESPLA
jgi:hypothetical protein